MKTAVEWLAEIKQGQKEQPFDDHEWQIAFEHAKEMEKEQMFKALVKGSDVYQAYDIELEFNEYYKETFKSEE